MAFGSAAEDSCERFIYRCEEVALMSVGCEAMVPLMTAVVDDGMAVSCASLIWVE